MTVKPDEYRKNMDEIDRKLVELFAERMKTASEIAAFKKEIPSMNRFSHSTGLAPSTSLCLIVCMSPE